MLVIDRRLRSLDTIEGELQDLDTILEKHVSWHKGGDHTIEL